MFGFFVLVNRKNEGLSEQLRKTSIIMLKSSDNHFLIILNTSQKVNHMHDQISAAFWKKMGSRKVQLLVQSSIINI